MYTNLGRSLVAILLSALMLLQGCTRLIYYKMRYPAATARNMHLLTNAPAIDMSRYQSIQNQQHRPWQRSDIAIAVAASGGGYRAANLTAGFMLGMQEFHHPNLRGSLLDEVDYYSTVSGSGFAVGAYISGLHDYLAAHPNVRDLSGFHYADMIGAFNLADQTRGMHGPLSTPFTDELFWAYVFGKKARGSHFQDQIDLDVLGKRQRGRSLVYGDVYVSKKDITRQAKLPYWIPNTTGFQNLQRVPLTPDIMWAYELTGYEHNHTMHPLQGPMSRPDYAYDVPLVIGLRTSANYPFALPPTVFASQGCTGACYLQLIDGGLADNTGILTALDVLYQDKAPIKILIVIDAFSGSIQPYSESNIEPGLLPTLEHIYQAIGDSRNEIKAHLHTISRAILCQKNTENVLVLYYDLDKITQARLIETKLDITPAEQALLLKTGTNLFFNNQADLDRLTSLIVNGHNDHYSHC